MNDAPIPRNCDEFHPNGWITKELLNSSLVNEIPMPQTVPSTSSSPRAPQLDFGRQLHSDQGLALRMVADNRLPDWMIRVGIRQLLRQRLRQESAGGDQARQIRLYRFLEEMRQSPIALVPEHANLQHYEVPAHFFELVLGSHRKYSCALWEDGTDTLEAAEAAMLDLTCARAGLADGQDILELGCGWGALSLFMARSYPASRITAVSNSHSQRAFIEAEARQLGLTNLAVVTADMNGFQAHGRFDRVVSVEMFEHMRNWEELLRRIATWMRDGAQLFVHIFVHRQFTYPFEDHGDADWMARYFFSGGMMPGADLLDLIHSPLRVTEEWLVSGQHYQKTAEAWLRNMDRHRGEILEIFARVYGPDQAQKWWAYWRVFFMACAELWGFREGSEWMVAHALLQRKA